MQEKFSLPVRTFLKQLAGNSCSLQCFSAVSVCRREQIAPRSLSCGTFITDQHSARAALPPPPPPSAHPQPCQDRESIPQSAFRKWGDSVRAAAHTSESLSSVNKCVSVAVWAFLWFWGNLGFFQLWVWVLFFLWFWVLFGGGSFVLLWVVFTTKYSLHLRIILYASETMQPNCFNILLKVVIG